MDKKGPEVYQKTTRATPVEIRVFTRKTTCFQGKTLLIINSL